MTEQISIRPSDVDAPEFKSTCVFGAIESGKQDGFVVFNLDIAGAGACRELGIEPVVAFVDASASNATPEGFFDWVQSKVGVTLSDWAPARVTLHEVWVSHSPSDRSSGASSLQLWMPYGPAKAARSCRRVAAFAVRHRAWRGPGSAATRRFLVELHQSRRQALWDRDRPGEHLTHLDCDPFAPGFVVHGKLHGAAASQPLTWPDADLEAVIRHASLFEAGGVEELAISEQGVLISFTSREKKDWLRLAALDRDVGCTTPALLIDAAMNGWIGAGIEAAP